MTKNSRPSKGVRFVMMPIGVADDPCLSPTAKAICLVIARHADNETHEAFPSYQTMAEKVGVSRRQIIRAMKYLIEAGVLSKSRDTDSNHGGYISNLYTLNFDYRCPSDTHVTSPGEVDVTSPSDTDVTLTRPTQLHPQEQDPIELDDTLRKIRKLRK